MGTSKSKPPARPGQPLVPSWADTDPPADGQNPAQQPPLQSPAIPPAAPPQLPPSEVIEPRRLSGFRRSLKRFYGSGDKSDARKALGHFARGSTGSGGASSRRIARAARVGGAVIAAISGAAHGNPVAANGFDLAALTGRPLSEAIGAIVDAFCPPGIFDEDLLRASIGEALAEALDGNDPFDAQAITDEATVIATRALIGELVFRQVMTEQGQAAENVPPAQAVVRENDFRSLVREVTDVHATPSIAATNGQLSQNQVAAIVQRVVAIVMQEASEW